MNYLGGRAKINCSKGCYDNDLGERVPQHRLPPAKTGDDLLEYWRPHRSGEIGAARDQRQRRAAPAVEPAADIDVQGCIDAADSDQADEQSVAYPQRPRRPEGGNYQAKAYHR